MQRWDVTEDEDDDDSEDHAGEEEPVLILREHENWKRSGGTYLSILVEDGRLLENTQAASAGGKKVEQLPDANVSHVDFVDPHQYLHDDERDEVDARRCIRGLVDIVGVILRVVNTKFQPHRVEWNSPALHVPKGHGERQEALVQSDEEVSMEDQPSVDQAIFLDVARRTKHEVGLRLLVGECDSCRAVCQATDDDHQER